MTQFLVPILMFLGAVGIFFGYITGNYEGIKTLRADAAQYDEALEKSAELKSVRDRLNATYRTFSPGDIEKLLTLLPDNLDNIRLALDLDAIASVNNLKVTDLALEDEGEESPEPPLGEVVESETLTLGTALLTFEVEGTYANLVAFLTDLEKNLRIVDIVDLTFIEGEEGVAQRYTIGIRMYWLK